MIHIITTGGTIEGLEYSKRRHEPKETNVKIQSFLESANVSFPFVVERVFSKDSRFITKDDLKILADKVDSSQSDKILITHGTITMVETAKFLGQLNLEKTIVLVGSFIIGLEKNTDAPFNLGYATCAIKQKDYLMLSPYLFEKVRDTGMNRRGTWPDKKPNWQLYPSIASKNHAASGHPLIWGDINL